MNAIWSCQFLYTLSEGRTRFALITTSKHRLPAKAPDEWEQIQNSFISLTDRTFLWNSALKTLYISVSFTHCCGHSYLCKPGTAAWPIYHNLWVGEDSQEKNLYVSFLKLLNSINGNYTIINHYKVNGLLSLKKPFKCQCTHRKTAMN